jgi:hypothetical protein
VRIQNFKVLSMQFCFYGGCPLDSDYEVHQVGPKDSMSHNFSPSALIGTELVSREISAAGSKARDRRIFSLSNHVKNKNKRKKIHFSRHETNNFPYLM